MLLTRPGDSRPSCACAFLERGSGQGGARASHPIPLSAGDGYSTDLPLLGSNPLKSGPCRAPGAGRGRRAPPQPLTGVPGLLRGPGGGPDRRREAGNREGRGEGGGGARAPHVRLTCRLPPAFSPPLLPPQPMGVGGASAPPPSPPGARCAVTCAARGGGGKRRRGAVGGGSGLR